MDTLNQWAGSISAAVWGMPMIILLLGTHIYLTIRLRFPQRHIFKAIKLSFSKDKDAEGDVSQFGALATALAATSEREILWAWVRPLPWADRGRCTGAG